MQYEVLACDYDGTLAADGLVGSATIAALEQCLQSGRRLVLVTGRLLEDLRETFPRSDLFEWIVAENGALLHQPATGEDVVVGLPPPRGFVAALKQAGVPCDTGRVIVATWRPHEAAVLETIRRFGMESQIIFNKGAVMVLPSGVNKATGLIAALDRMAVSPQRVVAIGDAENDHALLHACGLAVAVANAVPMLKQHADLVTRGDHGAGVVEAIQRLLADDLAGVEPRGKREPSAARAAMKAAPVEEVTASPASTAPTAG